MVYETGIGGLQADQEFGPVRFHEFVESSITTMLCSDALSNWVLNFASDRNNTYPTAGLTTQLRTREQS
jgi:hypothetical protein